MQPQLTAKASVAVRTTGEKFMVRLMQARDLSSFSTSSNTHLVLIYGSKASLGRTEAT